MHKHRLLIAMFKVGTFVAWLAGVPDPLIAAIVTPWACWFAYTTIRDGIREQFWIDPLAQARRFWEDLVWDHSTWSNGAETPEQAIERLTRHLQPSSPPPSPQRAPHELAIP